MIRVGKRPVHVSEHMALECAETFLTDGLIIDDDVAATIASWWQSPSSIGMPFTKVSQGTDVELHDLIDSIWIEHTETLRSGRIALLALLAWAWTTDDHVV